MTMPAVQTVQMRCHHCHQWVGESSAPMDFVGMFKDPRDRSMIPEPRDTYRCKHCGWANVFRPVAVNGGRQTWRAIELKRGD